MLFLLLSLSLSLPGVRTEQDLYIRLIDSMTKQVRCSDTFFFPFFFFFTRSVTPTTCVVHDLSKNKTGKKKKEKCAAENYNRRPLETKIKKVKIFICGSQMCHVVKIKLPPSQDQTYSITTVYARSYQIAKTPKYFFFFPWFKSWSQSEISHDVTWLVLQSQCWRCEKKYF